MRSSRVAAPVLALLLSLTVVPTVASASTSAELQEARERREGLEDRILDASENLEDLEERIHEAEEELEELEAQDDVLRDQLDEVAAQLAARAREAFMRGDGGALEAIVSGHALGDVAERAILLESLALRDQGTLEAAAALRVGLEQNRQLRAGRIAELDLLRAELDERLAQLDADLADAVADERFFELKARRQREIETAFANGIYACPVGDPVFFRDTWGAPRSGGRSHKGVDMMAPHGTPIYAIHAGRITRMNNSGLGGISIYMYGNDGNQYYYTHLQGYADGVGVGTYVDAGDLIAYNGATGNARGGAPHLHFEVHPGGGSAINPYPWVAAACGR